MQVKTHVFGGDEPDFAQAELIHVPNMQSLQHFTKHRSSLNSPSDQKFGPNGRALRRKRRSHPKLLLEEADSDRATILIQANALANVDKVGNESPVGKKLFVAHSRGKSSSGMARVASQYASTANLSMRDLTEIPREEQALIDANKNWIVNKSPSPQKMRPKDEDERLVMMEPICELSQSGLELDTTNTPVEQLQPKAVPNLDSSERRVPQNEQELLDFIKKEVSQVSTPM